MNRQNNICIIGNIGQNINSGVSKKTGDAYCGFSVGVNTSKQNEQGIWETVNTTWISVICFRHLAEYATQYLKKGTLVHIEGHVRQNTSTYIEKTSNQNVKKIEFQLVAEAINIPLQGLPKLLTQNSDNFNNANNNQQTHQQPKYNNQPYQQQQRPYQQQQNPYQQPQQVSNNAPQNPQPSGNWGQFGPSTNPTPQQQQPTLNGFGQNQPYNPNEPPFPTGEQYPKPDDEDIPF